MTKRQCKRLWMIFGSMIALSVGVGLILYAFRLNMDVYVLPSQIVTMPQDNRHLRLGGFIQRGSVDWHDLDIDFTVQDDKESVVVHFHGIPPALFREGQGVLIEGGWTTKGFMADRILAKHDENYRPPGTKEIE